MRRELSLDSDSEEDFDVDFGSVGLYIVGLQIIATLLMCPLTAAFASFILPSSAMSSVRTLICVCIISTILVRKPLRVGRPRGIQLVFNCLRPAVALYIASITVQQLVYTCIVEESSVSPSTSMRTVAYHSTSGLLMLSGLARARAPQADSDGPFLASVVGTIALALFLPVSNASHSGPLCSTPTLFQMAERCVRAVFFGFSYVSLAYASAPSFNSADEIFVCVMRTSAASMWVLVVNHWALLVVPFQVGAVLFSRLSKGSDLHYKHSESTEFTPLHRDGRRQHQHDLESILNPELEIDLAAGRMESSAKYTFKLAQRDALKSNGEICHNSFMTEVCNQEGGLAVTTEQLAEIVARESSEGLQVFHEK